MREIKLGLVLENACRLAGRDPSIQGVPDSWSVMAAMAVNGGMRRLYAEKFPVLKRIEFRRYRPTWSSGAGWTKGMECFYDGNYYRYEGTGTGSLAPSSTGSDWVRVPMEDLAAFIAFDQPWENTTMDPGGVDVESFAYVADPKYAPNAASVHGCGWFEDGVLIPAPAPEGVYCKFIPEAPRITFAEWSSGAAYSQGDTVYVTADREVYRATAASAGKAPGSNPGVWAPVRVADQWEDFLTRLVASQLQTEDQGKFQTQAAADAEFDRLVERFHEGSGDMRMRVGRFRR